MKVDLFETAAKQLEEKTDLDRLEARGTLRLALKGAGLDPKHLSLHELEVVFQKVMPDELRSRGIEDSEDACASIFQAVVQTDDLDARVSSDDVFSRLGGD